MKKSRSVLALVLCLCLFFEYIDFDVKQNNVYAVESLESKKNAILASAIQYIKSSQNEDGSFGDTYLINDTAEAAAVLSRFSDVDVSRSLAWLKSQNTESNIDTLSRTVMASGKVEDIKKLLNSVNTDGGVGLTDEYSSDILDSILVLEAVNSLDNTFHNNSTWKLVQYIARQMNKDGSFSYTKNSDPNDILTAMALYTVSKYMSDNKITSDITADMISKSKTHLSNKFDKSFPSENIEENLYIALALMESKSLDDIEGVIDSLADIQSEDGSFGNDVHLTSLAVWLLSKMDTEHLIQVYDLKMSNTSKAYYGVDSNIKVTYALTYEAQIDTPYQIKCVITNGKNTIYESESKEIKLSKKSNLLDGSFDGITINENKDDNVVVTIKLLDGDKVVKEVSGDIVMENQPRAGKTNLDDFALELSDYYTFVGNEISVNATYQLLYYTNVDNSVDMQVMLSCNGQNIDEKNYTEKMIPEEDSIVRDAISFTPDTTKEGIYKVTVRCLYDGNLVAENSADFYIINNPAKNVEEDPVIVNASLTDATQTDASKVEREKIPFTVSWIGPKLSDYLIYAGKEKDVNVSAGLLYYGDEGFEGIVTTEISKDDEVINTVNSDVDIPVGGNTYDIKNIATFTVKELGEYIVKTTLYDESGKEIKNGSKSVKVIDKKRIDLIADSTISNTEDKTINIRWNDISNSNDSYNYRLYRRYDGNDWEARSIWNEEDKVRVLNVYPYTPLLEDWMTTTISDTETPAGMGMFEIDAVYIGTFNGNPEGYLKDDNGSWKYDVLFFGSWDDNNGCDLSGHAADVVMSFVDSGRGALFGHDSVCVNNGHNNFARFGPKIGIDVKFDYDVYSGNTVSVVEYGTLTNFPWTLRGTLSIPYCHTYGQYAGGSLPGTEWMSIDANRKYDPNTNAHTNAYLVTYNNLGLIQTGHSNGQATDDERKVLANTLFYLHQISQVTTAKDNSFYDLAAPDAPDVKFTGIDGNKLNVNISAKDNGTKYQYYIEAISSTDAETENEKSNIMTHVALSGIDGYVFVINDKADEDKSILEFDENNEKVINLVKADESGEVKAEIEIPETRGKQYLHIYAVDKENNVSEKKIFPLDEGMLATDISTDKEEYLNNETAHVKSITKSLLYTEDGNVSITLYDSEDNFIEEVYYENEQSVSKAEPCEIDTDILLDESYSGDYKLKIEWEDEGKVLCEDFASFKVKEAEDEVIEEIVNPATPTDSNPPTQQDDTDSVEENKPSGSQNDQDKDSTDTDNKTDITDVPGNPSNPGKEVIVNPEATTETTTETATEKKTEVVNDKTKETEKTTSGKKAPETGDDMNIVLILICMFASVGIIGLIVFLKWKKKNK